MNDNAIYEVWIIPGRHAYVQLIHAESRKQGAVLSLLSLGFEPGPDGTGRVVLVLAGDGAVALEVECLNATLRDVTRPYLAPSGKVPGHRA